MGVEFFCFRVFLFGISDFIASTCWWLCFVHFDKKYFYVISGLLVAVLCAVASLAVLGIVIEIYEIITNTPLHKRGNYRFFLKIMAVPALIGILLAGLVSASGPEKPQRPIIPF
jgi:heme A synthase